MEKYQDLVKYILQSGTHERNRTAEDTIATFGYNYKLDVEENYPLLTTKKMDTFRWDSMLHELEWYLSGQHHIRELTEETSIWDAWADEDMNLPSAYGRFWRRFPVPTTVQQLNGEEWMSRDSEYTTFEHVEYVDNDEEDAYKTIGEEKGRLVFDQLEFIVDALNNDNPYRGPESRRLVTSAWHPANAQSSSLPPCHFTYVFNVQNDRLNLHLTQRSADVALGVPFNIAAYSLLLKLIAKQTKYKAGHFNHTLVDAHIYCGKGERSDWYNDNLAYLASKLSDVSGNKEYMDIHDWIIENAPTEDTETNPDNGSYGYDHIPGLIKQLSRKPKNRPNINISESTTIDNAEYDDFELKNYDSYGGLSFNVAE